MSGGAKYALWLTGRHLPLALGIVSLGTVATYSTQHLIEHQFTASTYLLVETGAVSRAGRKDDDATITPAHLHGIQARLMTTERLEHLRQTVGLSTPLDALETAITFDTESGRDKTTIMQISVSDPDGKLAADAANLLGQGVIAEHQTIRDAQIDDSLRFFRQEVSDAKTQLDQAFDAMLAFKTTQAGLLPEDAGRYLDQRRALVNRKPEPPSPATPNPAFSQLESDYMAASALFSNQNPRVRALALQLEQTLPFLNEPASQEPIQTADLTQIDAALASIPANGLRLAALGKTHDLAQQQYEVALSRLDAAAIDARISQQAKNDRITIMEPASPPELPSSSRRKIALSAGLALSVLLALAVVILRVRSDPYIRRPYDLRAGMNITPYAVIPT